MALYRSHAGSVRLISTCLGLLLAPMILVGSAAEPPAQKQGPPSEPLAFRAWLRRSLPEVKAPEIGEMLWTLATGGDLAPGQGWFHAGQSRYGWEWLAQHFDTNHDGKITKDEFKGPAELFDRLDRDHDGVLTAEDFDWSDKSSFLSEARPIRKWFRTIDANSNGRISRQEWEAFFAKASKGKEYLTPDDLREMLQPPEKKEQDKKTDDDPSPLVLLKGFLTGELGSICEGPALGDRAPEFALKTQDGKQEIRLSDYQGKKPVVLIFGSFT
jgi:EF-hand domain pair/AhpC/TSA family/EF hand